MSFSQNDRHLIVITGKQSDCLKSAEQLVLNLDSLLLSDTKKANNYLGQEFDAVVFNRFSHEESFDANAFGAISGTIRVGGYLLLLQAERDTKESLFLNRFNQLLKTHSNVTFVNPLEHSVSALEQPKKKSRQSLSATPDQNKIIEAISHVLKGHRRRPLLITADRGRGKSAALGMAAAKLINEGYENIIVCAPSKKSAAVIFEYFTSNNKLKVPFFYSPDELNRIKPKADLVLIDEAAAIPIPLLSSFLKHYSRIVFSSTQHGYEGSGRGFSTNFHKILNTVTPNWNKCTLETPIRWNKNDSLEALTFDTLLLNTEAAENDLVEAATLDSCQYKIIKKQTLLNDEEKLKSLFGLLISAHYQTKPSDLVQLLDDDAVSIHTLEFNQQTIAVVLLIKEGEINSSIAQDVYKGKRRLKGHLVAQSLAANLAIENAPMLKGARVSRIAVHPTLQQQGFGSYLLKKVIENTNADYISTSFGATTLLINFWSKADFTPVYLGMKRDASSGTHSVLMLLPKSKEGQSLVEQAKQRFSQHFPHLLSEPFKALEANIALALINSFTKRLSALSTNEIKELNAFACDQRGYENSIYPLWKLVIYKLSEADLEKNEQAILLHKVLQKHTWQDVTKIMSNLSGKKEALILLRKAISRLLMSK